MTNVVWFAFEKMPGNGMASFLQMEVVTHMDFWFSLIWSLTTDCWYLWRYIAYHDCGSRAIKINQGRSSKHWISRCSQDCWYLWWYLAAKSVATVLSRSAKVDIWKTGLLDERRNAVQNAREEDNVPRWAHVLGGFVEWSGRLHWLLWRGVPANHKRAECNR